MNNEEAIAVLQNELDGIPFDLDKSDFEQALEIAIKAIRNEPIDDLSDYSDKLWQKAYERGKAEARPQGKWKALDYHTCYCTNCHFDFDIMKCDFMAKMTFCPNCGADMRKEAENEP